MDPFSWTLNRGQLRPHLQGDGVVGCITLTLTEFGASDWLRSEISPTSWFNGDLRRHRVILWRHCNGIPRLSIENMLNCYIPLWLGGAFSWLPVIWETINLSNYIHQHKLFWGHYHNYWSSMQTICRQGGIFTAWNIDDDNICWFLIVRLNGWTDGRFHNMLCFLCCDHKISYSWTNV